MDGRPADGRRRAGDRAFQSRAALKHQWIIWLAIGTHALWGALLLASEDVLWITAIHHTAALGFGRWSLACLYLAVAGLSLFGLVKKLRPQVALLLMLPQQFVLTFSAIGAIGSIVASQFADGVIRPRAFIAADQCPAVFLAIGHTGAILTQFFADLR